MNTRRPHPSDKCPAPPTTFHRHNRRCRCSRRSCRKRRKSSSKIITTTIVSNKSSSGSGSINTDRIISSLLLPLLPVHLVVPVRIRCIRMLCYITHLQPSGGKIATCVRDRVRVRMWTVYLAIYLGFYGCIPHTFSHISSHTFIHVMRIKIGLPSEKCHWGRTTNRRKEKEETPWRGVRSYSSVMIVLAPPGIELVTPGAGHRRTFSLSSPFSPGERAVVVTRNTN